MKTFGFIYLIAYLLDAIVSIAAVFVPTLEYTSNLISTPLGILAVVVFFLVLFNRLKPKILFLILSSYYISMLFYGVILGVAIAIKLGPKVANQSVGESFLREHFSWYGHVEMAILFLWLFIAVIGLYRYYKIQAQQGAAANASRR